MSEAQGRTRFFANSGWLMGAMVVASFPVTYFAPIATASRHFSLLHHLHGAAFFAWIGLYAYQAELAARRRLARHRELGLISFALTGAMIPLGFWMASFALQARIAKGAGSPFENSFYNCVDITLFALLMSASILNVTRRPDWHKRLTFAAALCLVGPAISRWVLKLPEVFPLTDAAPNLIADLFLIALARYDFRENRRIHPATWVALGMVPIHAISPWIATSKGWSAIAPRLFGLG